MLMKIEMQMMAASAVSECVCVSCLFSFMIKITRVVDDGWMDSRLSVEVRNRPQLSASFQALV